MAEKSGSRKRMYVALSGWSHETFSTNAGVTGPAYSARRRKRARAIAHKLLRASQKRQDRFLLNEQIG
jgi:hypothetical protein